MEGEQQIASETLRYATDLPGQALCYRKGYLEFMRLRAETQVRLGTAFELADFHETILSQGALPISLLRSSIAEMSPVA